MEWQIITYNIRRSGCDDGVNVWPARAPHAVEWLQARKPDVVGFQEMMPDAGETLREALTEYDWAGCGRMEDLGDEGCPVAWRREAFTAVRWETFWLSDDPDLPGSHFAGHRTDLYIWPRVATLVELQSRQTNQRFFVCNTHLDCSCELSKREGVRLIAERVASRQPKQPLPLLVMGDFNATPDSEVITQFEQAFAGKLRNFADRTEWSKPYTFHGFGDDRFVPDQIDYIYASPEWTKRGSELGDWCENGLYLSDHYPVIARVTL